MYIAPKGFLFTESECRASQSGRPNRAIKAFVLPSIFLRSLDSQRQLVAWISWNLLIPSYSRAGFCENFCLRSTTWNLRKSRGINTAGKVEFCCYAWEFQPYCNLRWNMRCIFLRHSASNIQPFNFDRYLTPEVDLHSWAIYRNRELWITCHSKTFQKTPLNLVIDWYSAWVM